MSATCKINFENKLNVFYTGQEIRGNVQLKLEDCAIIRSVYIEFLGVAHIENANNKLSSRTETYLNRKFYLLGSDDGKPIRLLHGTHDYSFDCHIPPELPTSIEGEYGHMRYIIRTVLNLTHWPHSPHQIQFEDPFTVIRPKDLNLHPSLENPVIVRHSETFLSSNPLRIAARLPVGGYVPGQTINLKISANNESDETVLKFDVHMIKEIIYHICPDNDQTRIETIILSAAETVGCDKKRDQIIFLNVPVPSIPPNDCCNIINCKYYIRIRCEMENCIYSSPVLDIPIEIGTYPLKNGAAQTTTNDLNDANAEAPNLLQDKEENIPLSYYVKELPSAPSMSSVFDKGDSSVESSGEPSSFLHDDPPTYEEAMMNDPKGNKFRPKYPTYRRQTSYSIGG